MISLNSTPDGRITALKNELDTLAYLDRFGWLRSRDLATLIWRNSKNIESAIAMAQRTLKRLKEAGQILHRIGPDGATVYALAIAGVIRLGQERDIDARTGKDLIRDLGNYEHRCLANTFAIRQIIAGQRVWTEREIQTNRAPIRAVKHKVPDGLVDISNPLYAEGTLVLAWVEIERGYKKTSDFNKMLGFALEILGHLDSQGRSSDVLFCAAKDTYIGQVTIQITSTAQFNRIVSEVRAENLKRPYDFGWGNITSRLYLAGPTGVSRPISTWLAQEAN